MSRDFIELKNSNGCRAVFTCYGARWVSMYVPDNKGVFQDVILGFDSLEGYKNASEQYHGAIVGRVCGRIRNASFVLNGISYNLASNDVYGSPIRNHLHGGFHGFHKKTWNYQLIRNSQNEEGIKFTCISIDGEEGYPGKLEVEVTYLLTNDNSIEMTFRTISDKDSYINLTNHAFFNLSGYNGNNVLSHYLKLNDVELIECDEDLLPTGNILDIKNDTIEFDGSINIKDSILKSKMLSLKEPDISLAYALNNKLGIPTAILSDEESGRKLSIYTDCSSIQVYNAYFMDGTDIGKNDIPLNKYAGIAIEPQGYPDAPNVKHFPSILITPEKPVINKTIYKFGLI